MGFQILSIEWIHSCFEKIMKGKVYSIKQKQQKLYNQKIREDVFFFLKTKMIQSKKNYAIHIYDII